MKKVQIHEKVELKQADIVKFSHANMMKTCDKRRYEDTVWILSLPHHHLQIHPILQHFFHDKNLKQISGANSLVSRLLSSLFHSLHLSFRPVSTYRILSSTSPTFTLLVTKRAPIGKCSFVRQVTVVFCAFFRGIHLSLAAAIFELTGVRKFWIGRWRVR